jgi:hypothetical protein
MVELFKALSSEYLNEAPRQLPSFFVSVSMFPIIFISTFVLRDDDNSDVLVRDWGIIREFPSPIRRIKRK